MTAAMIAPTGNTIRGRLHISGDALTLSRDRMRDVCWPLAYIRRYGYDHDVFSIESGRRANTGAGLFTFMCDNGAEHVFAVRGSGSISVLHSGHASAHRSGRDSAVGHPPAPAARQHVVVGVTAQFVAAVHESSTQRRRDHQRLRQSVHGRHGTVPLAQRRRR